MSIQSFAAAFSLALVGAGPQKQTQGRDWFSQLEHERMGEAHFSLHKAHTPVKHYDAHAQRKENGSFDLLWIVFQGPRVCLC